MMPDTTQLGQKVEQHFSKYPLRTYTKGQILIHAGDIPQHIFYLVSGKVRQYDISYRGDEIIVQVYKPGAFFPMLWAITGVNNEFFFDAETDVEVRVAPAQESVQFLKDNPDVTFDLLTRVYRGLDGILGRVVHLMTGNAKSRLLYELLVEAKRFGQKQPDGATLITITEGDMAARAGLSRETVSREVQKLIRDGIITKDAQGTTIKSLTKADDYLSEKA
jgi:CRP-like cAMP-binding protein